MGPDGRGGREDLGVLLRHGILELSQTLVALPEVILDHQVGIDAQAFGIGAEPEIYDPLARQRFEVVPLESKQPVGIDPENLGHGLNAQTALLPFVFQLGAEGLRRALPSLSR